MSNYNILIYLSFDLTSHASPYLLSIAWMEKVMIGF